MKRSCIFLDVFTDKPYAGNQLAVFPDGNSLDSERMQRLEQEINYSETTFILPHGGPEADFEVRIFTVKSEMPFAGHPVIGTAYAIMNILDIWREKKDILRLKTKVGVIPVEKKGGNIWMTQNEPRFARPYTDKKEIAALVNLLPEDISDTLPVQEVSTGNNILIVPVKSLSAVRKAVGHVDNLVGFSAAGNVLAPYLFTLETTGEEASVHTRFFAPHKGIMEDPATGSAAGPLTAYLLKYGVFGQSFEIQNEQGMEMGRPSIILMKGKVENSRYTIQIGGKCAFVGEGWFEI